VTVKHSVAAIPFIIGKAGRRINEIKQRWDCDIDIGVPADPNDTTVTTTIRGVLLDSLNRAKAEIQGIDARAAAESNPEVAAFTAVVSNIPPGLAIGKGGCNIKKARSTFPVAIQVVDDANEVKISGASRAHVELARKFFADLVANSFERPVPQEVNRSVLREFKGICETMFGVLIHHRQGEESALLVGQRDKVVAAEEYLRARARDADSGRGASSDGTRGGGNRRSGNASGKLK
jgi:polyribonucleotide nucleotidyltransferase